MKLATTIAKISQAATSPIAPAASASVPIAVPVRPRSLRMRASIGKAVIDSEAPRNSAAWLALIDSLKKPPFERSRIPTPPPSANGARIPASDTAAAFLMARRSSAPSNSRPTVNM